MDFLLAVGGTWLSHDAIDLLIKGMGAIGALVAFVLGLGQYRKGQHWKRAETILGLIDGFRRDPYIQAACLMLDWDERLIRIKDGPQIDFQNSMLKRGLRILWMNEDKNTPLDAAPVTDKEGINYFTAEEVVIRDCFDVFFDYFDKINAFPIRLWFKFQTLAILNTGLI